MAVWSNVVSSFPPLVPLSAPQMLAFVFWVIWLMSTSSAVTHPNGLLIASCPLLPDHRVLVLGPVLEALSESCRGGQGCVPRICRQGHERVHPCGFITHKILTQMQTCISSLKPTYSLFSLFFFLFQDLGYSTTALHFCAQLPICVMGCSRMSCIFYAFSPSLSSPWVTVPPYAIHRALLLRLQKYFQHGISMILKFFLLWNISSTEKSIYNVRLEFREKYWNGLVYPSDCLQNRTMPVLVHILWALLRSHRLLCSGQPRSILGLNQSSSGWFRTCMSP